GGVCLSEGRNSGLQKILKISSSRNGRLEKISKISSSRNGRLEKISKISSSYPLSSVFPFRVLKGRAVV
ncbi:MAG: hypothetical protein NT112_04885, partial [Methanoregula sp.]|nr:hypothetical protein [Methanoregula sp.]